MNKYFNWTVIDSSVVRNGKRSLVMCRCECGVERLVDLYRLKNGLSKSCGCIGKVECGKKNAIKNLRHGGYVGGAPTPEYSAWSAMKRRCENKNDKKYPSYGGRGIVVCSEWTDSFEAFLSHMGPRTSPKHSIDRIDNNKGYAPGNVRWATSKEQNLNKRTSRLVDVGGQLVGLLDLSKMLGIGYSCLTKRWRLGRRTYAELSSCNG